MSNPVTLNLGNGFGLVLPKDRHILMGVKVEIKFTTADDNSSVECVLNYPPKVTVMKP